MIEHVFEDISSKAACCASGPEDGCDGCAWECLDVAEAPGRQRWSECSPNGMLADLLAQLPLGDRDRDVLDDRHGMDFESLERVGAWERIIAWAQAAQMREIAGFVGRAQAHPPTGVEPDEAAESAAAEVGLMLQVAPRTASQRVSQALTLAERLPATLAALGAGRISLSRARVIDQETVHLPAEHAAAVENAVLGRAETQTPGQLRAATRRAVLRVDPEAARKRHAAECRDRNVRLDPELDGMATLSAYLPAPDARRIYSAVDEHARRAGHAGDERSTDARRADALVDLVLDGTCPAGTAAGTAADTAAGRTAPDAAGGAVTTSAATRPASRAAAHVRVTMSMSTLLGLGAMPAELAGYGPITAEIARDIAGDATLQRLLTDPATGAPVDYGTTRYTPPTTLAEQVIARDQTCRFPGCRVPADRCDLDHSEPHDPETGAGPTNAANLSAKCRRHHRIKHRPGWSANQDPDGSITWTTPSGHTYTSVPPPTGGVAAQP